MSENSRQSAIPAPPHSAPETGTEPRANADPAIVEFLGEAGRLSVAAPGLLILWAAALSLDPRNTTASRRRRSGLPRGSSGHPDEKLQSCCKITDR